MDTNINSIFSIFRQVLYSEQIRGFPGKRMLTLRCELFGLAGHYALVLRPTTPMPSLSNTAAYVKVRIAYNNLTNLYPSRDNQSLF